MGYRVKKEILEGKLIEKYGFEKTDKDKFPYGSLEVKDKDGLGVSVWWANNDVQILLGDHAEYGVAEIPPVLVQMIKDNILEENMEKDYSNGLEGNQEDFKDDFDLDIDE